MAVLRKIYAQSISFNSVTYSASSGGPIEIRYTLEGENVSDRTSDDEFPTFVAIVNKDCVVNFTLRDVEILPVQGTKDNIVGTLTDGKSDTGTFTFANMVLRDITMVTSRATPGQVDFSFVHESADGSTVPLTIT